MIPYANPGPAVPPLARRMRRKPRIGPGLMPLSFDKRPASLAVTETNTDTGPYPDPRRVPPEPPGGGGLEYDAAQRRAAFDSLDKRPASLAATEYQHNTAPPLAQPPGPIPLGSVPPAGGVGPMPMMRQPQRKPKMPRMLYRRAPAY